MKYCRYCGSLIKDDSIFCPECGRDLRKKPKPSSTTTTSQQNNATYDKHQMLGRAKVLVEENKIPLGPIFDPSTFTDPNYRPGHGQPREIEPQNNVGVGATRVPAQQYSHDNNQNYQQNAHQVPQNGHGGVNANLTQEEKDAKKIKRNKKIFLVSALLIIFIAAGLFIAGMVVTYKVPGRIGNTILIISAFVDFILGFSLYWIINYRVKYICPECGKKRKHHREWLSTDESVKEGDGSTTYTYKHHYHDTYVCPNCGATDHFQVTRRGGSYTEFDSGHCRDNRQAPEEF